MRTLLVIFFILATSVRAELPSYRDNPAYQQPPRLGVSDGLRLLLQDQQRQDRIRRELDQQRQEMNYQQQLEHLRNQGWGRPGLDGVQR